MAVDLHATCDERIERLDAENGNLHRELRLIRRDHEAACKSAREAESQLAQARELSRQATDKVAELVMEVARLESLCAEWSRQNLAIVALEVEARKRAGAAEAEVARLQLVEKRVEMQSELIEQLVAGMAEARRLLIRRKYNDAYRVLCRLALAQQRAP